MRIGNIMYSSILLGVGGGMGGGGGPHVAC